MVRYKIIDSQGYASDHYEICIQGHLHDRWADWFGGMTIEREQNGQTCLRGPVTDQAALHGILRRVRDTGLPLVSVTRIPPEPGAEQEAR